MQLSAALERVRAGADIMPQRQLHKQLTDQLGPEWRSKLASFEDEPLAAASIGQVGCAPHVSMVLYVMQELCSWLPMTGSQAWAPQRRLRSSA